LQKALGTLKEDEISRTPEVQHLIDFIQSSERGITR
jgi:acyl-[acyl carrier protein]--UDP-N-acetylglucosamine O-acyltransferase